MAEPGKGSDQKSTIVDTTVSIDDSEEDLLYTYKQKNDNSQMRWNNSLCRKPRK